MNTILGMEIEWLLECIEMFVFLKLILVQKTTKDKWKILFSSIIGISSILVIVMAEENEPILLLFISFLCFFLLLEGSYIWRCCTFFFVCFLMNYLNHLYSVLISIFCKEHFYVYLECYPANLLKYLMGIGICVLVGLVSCKNETWRQFWVTISDSFFLIASICELLFSFYFMSAIDIAKQYANVTLQNLVVLGSTCAGIAIIIVIIALFGANKLRLYYKMESLLKDEYLKASRDYCNVILENEKEIRKMRHDMRGHVTALDYLLKEKNYTALSEYLKEMDNEIEKNTLIRATGNELLDAILTRYQMEEENVRYEVTGVLSYHEMSDYDMCILFSNIISNAVEACKRLKRAERVVTIHFKKMGENFILSVSNPIEEEIKIEQLGQYTSKADAANHGFGIQRMREVVEKYKGTIDFRVENQRFMVTVILN